jgi:ubiquinone/menaquinone biosynthesis C-methylase UbiE
MTTEERYFTESAPDQAELARLQLLEKYLDPITKDALLSAGLSSGSKVLEIGPGAGSMMRWMAEQVGPTGHITGLDINPRFLRELDLPNASLVNGDILDPPKELGSFDIIYSRYVMLHLPDPVEVLRVIYSLLVPGGKAVTIDPDLRTLAAVDPTHPKTVVMDHYRDTAIEVFSSAGIMDLLYGPKAAADYVEAGFTNIAATGTSWMMHCATPELTHFPASVDPTEATINAYAPEVQVDFDAVRETYNDPDMMLTSSIEVITTGTRPRE